MDLIAVDPGDRARTNEGDVPGEVGVHPRQTGTFQALAHFLEDGAV